MTLNDLNEMAEKMGVDPAKGIEILFPDGEGSWDYTHKFGIQKAKDGGLYITPASIQVGK